MSTTSSNSLSASFTAGCDVSYINMTLRITLIATALYCKIPQVRKIKQHWNFILLCANARCCPLDFCLSRSHKSLQSQTKLTFLPLVTTTHIFGLSLQNTFVKFHTNTVEQDYSSTWWVLRTKQTVVLLTFCCDFIVASYLQSNWRTR